MTVRVLTGDCRDVLRTLPEGSVQCCVTSPPYFGLRDYGVDGQIGLEQTLEAFVAEMVAVFREVRRVLRDEGTLWLNLGDSYASGGRRTRDPGQSKIHPAFSGDAYADGLRPEDPPGIKPKDLMLVPERVALALQADGWYVRSRIIWHKLSAMPESVTDRPTKAHEHIWLLSKSERYFYDKEAASEPVTQDERRPTFRGGAYCNNSTFDNSEGGQSTVTGNVRVGVGHNERPRKAVPNVKRSGNKERKPASACGVPVDTDGKSAGAVAGSVPLEGSMRNWRDVWPIGPEPFKDAHYATFPTEIPRRAILAGSRPGDLVLDPFFGAGTTGLVADRLQRHCIGIELNPEYADMARRRIHGDAPLLAEVA